MPKILISYWKPRTGQGNFFEMQEVFAELAQRPAKQRMVRRGPEYTDYLVSAEKESSSVIGSAARIRMEDLPERMNATTGEVRQLDLENQEGLAEEAFFLYDSTLQVLLLQQSGFFRVPSFENLIRELAEIEDFWMEPVLRRDAWERFNKMERIASIDFKLTDLSHRPDLAKAVPSLGEMLDHANSDINAITAEVRLGVGRRRNEGLVKAVIRKLSRALASSERVSAVTVRGTQSDTGKSEEIDFLRERLVLSGQVEFVGRRLDVQQCRQLLRNALHEQTTYLSSLVRLRAE